MFLRETLLKIDLSFGYLINFLTYFISNCIKGDVGIKSYLLIISFTDKLKHGTSKLYYLCSPIHIICCGQGRIQPLGRGGAKLLTNDGGSRGLAPWRGSQGGRAPLRREILNFWTQFAQFSAYFLPTSYWKSLDLFPIKVFFFFWIMQ